MTNSAETTEFENIESGSGDLATGSTTPSRRIICHAIPNTWLKNPTTYFHNR